MGEGAAAQAFSRFRCLWRTRPWRRRFGCELSGVNVSYESETTIAEQIGVDGGALNGWLAGKVKPTFQSLLKIRDFLERQVETRGGIAPVGYVPIKGNNPN